MKNLQKLIHCRISITLSSNYNVYKHNLQLIQQEQQQRREIERGAKEENDRKWTAIKNVQEEQAQEIKELMKVWKINILTFLYTCL